MRRGELLGIRPENVYKYGIKVRESISPTSKDTSLKTQNSKRDVSINKAVYNILANVPVKKDGYLFHTDGFNQSRQLAKLLKKLDIEKLHSMVYEIHMHHSFSLKILILRMYPND